MFDEYLHGTYRASPNCPKKGCRVVSGLSFAVCAPIEQYLRSFALSLSGSDHKGSKAYRVPDLDISTVVKQNLHNFPMSSASR
jgi:hypothetical protein